MAELIDKNKFETYTKIANEFGTPAYVFDKDEFEYRINHIKKAATAFDEFRVNTKIYYASKSLLTVQIAKMILENDLYIDCCSEGEILIAEKGAEGLSDYGKRFSLHGNNKTVSEIEYAINNNFSHLVIDSDDEIDFVNDIAKRLDKKVNVLLRVNTGIHAGGHEYICTSHEDQKFGVPIRGGVAAKLLNKINEKSNLKLEGIHSHIGSQILDSAAFRLNAEILLEFRMNLLKDSDINLDVVNFGGGFGVAYVTEEIKEIKCICDIMSSMAEVFAEYSKIENGLPTTICFEPGRFISAPSMVSVYTVGTTKDVALENGNSRRYISIDGGMSDNIRPALYKADYEAFLVSRESEAPLISSKVVGKYCESGDFIINSQELPSDIKRGDILCVPTTGAYSYSMASNYNSTYRLPIIQIGSGDEPKLIIRRECAEDLLRREV